MRTAFAPFVLWLLLCPALVQAGAWPRERGTGFVSVSHVATTGAETVLLPMQDLRGYTSIFAEYGLTERWTIGLDAGRASGNEGGGDAALAFLRRPIWRSGSGWHVAAAEFGIGVLTEPGDGFRDDGTSTLRLRPGLSWGSGFESRFGAGWVALDTSAEYRPVPGETALKADATAGLKPTDSWMLIAQAQTSRNPGSGLLVRFVPSVVRRLGSRLHLQLGGIVPVAGDDAVGGKVSAWVTF